MYADVCMWLKRWVCVCGLVCVCTCVCLCSQGEKKRKFESKCLNYNLRQENFIYL